MKRMIAFLTCIVTAFVTSSAFACAVCFVGKGGASSIYLGTTIILSLLPLGMVGGVVFWLYRRYKGSMSEEDVSRQDSFLPNQHSSTTYSS